MKNRNTGLGIISIFLSLGLIGLLAVIIVRGGGPGGQSLLAAAISADLSTAEDFAVLASTYTNTVPGTTINGDLGYTTGPAMAPTVNGATHVANAEYNQAGTDQGNALSDLNAQACDFNFGSPTDLSLLSQPLAPGVYCITAATTIGTGGITLDGTGAYIFRIDGALNTVANSEITLSGDISACDVFWTPTSATTLGANSVFEGTIIDDAGITVGSNVTWTGRALAFGGTVTTDADNISTPSCITPPASGSITIVKEAIGGNATFSFVGAFGPFDLTTVGGTGSQTFSDLTPGDPYAISETALVDWGQTSAICSDGSPISDIDLGEGEDITCTFVNTHEPGTIAPQLIVTKVVVNDNGGTKVISDFSIFFDGASVVSGATNITTVGLHTISETPDSSYTTIIGGDCAANGTITLASGDVKTCTITNDDIAVSSSGGGSSRIPPLIAVVKVPNPLALPNGPGSVIYTYTLRNVGTVAVSDVTMVGDSCVPIVLVSGDTNSNDRLDLNETWVYSCQTNLSKTHTNIVTATGWANRISTSDIASATVVVGVPGLPDTGVVPPLIHITKVPSSFALSVGGGMITYTQTITNLGIIPISNVRVTDDKCSPMNYISGDTNSDSILDTTETWIYTCASFLTQTTTNTVTVEGVGNGITVRDFAIATVVVSIPGLPDTGFPPKHSLLVE